MKAIILAILLNPLPEVVSVNGGEAYLIEYRGRYFKKNLFGKIVEVKPLKKTKIERL